MKTQTLYDLTHTKAAPLLMRFTYPWEALAELKAFILALGQTLPRDMYVEVKENVWIAKSANVYESAYIAAPCIIGENTEVRHGAFIRGSALIGDGCVVGNSTELKNAVLFDNVQVPHFNYVGDSVLGYRSHLGAGAVTSNVKSDKTLVTVSTPDGRIETGLKKFGAMVGDYTEVGCNSVLCPGTVLGKNCTVYPLSRVRGYIAENSIFKAPDNIVVKR